jgi:hypothetical protein
MKRTITKVSYEDFEYTSSLLTVHCDKITAGIILEFIGKLKADIELENRSKNESIIDKYPAV